MASRYQTVKDEAELLALYRAGLLLLNYSNGHEGMFSFYSCSTCTDEDESIMLDRFRRAHYGNSSWAPVDFAYLVDDDEDG